jgi:hypothetical protein
MTCQEVGEGVGETCEGEGEGEAWWVEKEGERESCMGSEDHGSGAGWTTMSTKKHFAVIGMELAPVRGEFQRVTRCHSVDFSESQTEYS